MKRWVWLVSVQIFVACGVEAASPVQPLLKTIEDIVLPGDTSRFDYASIDALRHRLYMPTWVPARSSSTPVILIACEDNDTLLDLRSHHAHSMSAV